MPQPPLFPEKPGLQVATCEFDEMNLQIGERIELERMESTDKARYFTSLIGYMRNQSLLIKTPIVEGLPLPIEEDAIMTVRVFSGTNAFAFIVPVIRVCISPAHYMHLAFPSTIQCTEIRKTLRVSLHLTAKAKLVGEREFPQEVVLTDLSTNGAHVESDKLLGQKGQHLHLSFAFRNNPNDYEAHLNLKVRIQNVEHQTPAHEGGAVYVHGVEFEDLGSAETILLQSYIYQLLIAEHHRVI
ncbi:MAG: flagellar brake protein [Burkholderiales bacterium]|nr:flagellar brake protein [Burkholderiales bacterium]